jgi:hypothetical protein
MEATKIGEVAIAHSCGVDEPLFRVPWLDDEAAQARWKVFNTNPPDAVKHSSQVAGG